ncbi:hypothetical protein ACS0TY_033677 [Phlomoides rotata]
MGHHKDDCYTYGGKPHPPHHFAATTPKNVKGKVVMHDDGASAAAAPRKLKIAKVANHVDSMHKETPLQIRNKFTEILYRSLGIFRHRPGAHPRTQSEFRHHQYTWSYSRLFLSN